jgi:hypothetical protein
MPATGSMYFDADPAVIVQLHADSPMGCWSSTFDATGISRNDQSQFTAHSP